MPYQSWRSQHSCCPRLMTMLRCNAGDALQVSKYYPQSLFRRSDDVPIDATSDGDVRVFNSNCVGRHCHDDAALRHDDQTTTPLDAKDSNAH
jgi:hypothetical protein